MDKHDNQTPDLAPIGVFDSGVGGLALAHAIRLAFPERTVLLRDDAEHLPYGNKTADELLALVLPILKELEAASCEVIVIACNTVTTTIIDRLRERLSVPLVGVEPMVKVASDMTQSACIAVCATPATLASKRYAWFKETFAAPKGVQVVEPDCSQWAAMIQADQVNHAHIAATIEATLALGADVIVLGCTYYHWIEELIRQLVDGRATVIQPEPAIIRRLTTMLEQQQ